MNTKLIFQLSLFGVAMAFSTVYFIPSNIEPICWLLIFVVCAIIVAKKCLGKYFLNGLMVSLVNSVASITNKNRFHEMIDTELAIG